MRAATAEKVQGSVAETPQIWLVIKRVKARAAANPAIVPVAIRPRPFLSTMRRTSFCWAPKAIRMPISCVCSDAKDANQNQEQSDTAERCENDESELRPGVIPASEKTLNGSVVRDGHIGVHFRNLPSKACQD